MVEIKKEDEHNKGRKLIRRTLRGSVSPPFALGSDVDESAPRASLDNSILRRMLPKRQGVANHRLSIK